LGSGAMILKKANGAHAETAVDMPALLLVGGMGTRLQSVLPSTPKPLAPLGEAPFLELLVTQLRTQDVRRLVLCTGYLAGQIEERFGNGQQWGMAIEYSKETQPLGTAGAVKLAEDYLHGVSDFVVMNGDSFLEMDLRQLIRFHVEHEGIASLATHRVPNAGRYGTVRVNASQRITAFEEKSGREEPGLISAGVYVFKRAVLERIQNGPASLEKDIFPELLNEGMFALQQEGMFIDIGTPEDYARAQTLCRGLQEAAASRSR
jgi:D-glycero-alpha-D-manno-heptose 1-phosphate guanylyltransferase